MKTMVFNNLDVINPKPYLRIGFNNTIYDIYNELRLMCNTLENSDNIWEYVQCESFSDDILIYNLDITKPFISLILNRFQITISNDKLDYEMLMIRGLR